VTAQYHLVAHPDLRDHLRQLRDEAQRDPEGPAAKEFAAVRDGLSVLREGREADFDGKRLGYSENASDLRDCAEIKVAVVDEFTRRGRPMGPSHRLIYREFEGTGPGQLPVRQVIAFAPRRDGRAFDVAADRLGRAPGVPLAELDHLPTFAPRNGREPGRPITPAREPLPPDLAQALKALEGNPSPRGAVAPPGSIPSTAPPGVVRRPPERGGPTTPEQTHDS
jgi:hypothetical protein